MFNIRKPLIALALLLLAAGSPAFAAGHAAPPSPVDAPIQWLASLWQDVLAVTGFVDPEPAEAQPSTDPPPARSASRDGGGEHGEIIESAGADNGLGESVGTTGTESELGEGIEPHG